MFFSKNLWETTKQGLELYLLLQRSSITRGSHKLKKMNLYMSFIHPLHSLTTLPEQYKESSTQILLFLFLINRASVHLQAPLLEFLAQASLTAAWRVMPQSSLSYLSITLEVYCGGPYSVLRSTWIKGQV